MKNEEMSGKYAFQEKLVSLGRHGTKPGKHPTAKEWQSIKFVHVGTHPTIATAIITCEENKAWDDKSATVTWQPIGSSNANQRRQ